MKKYFFSIAIPRPLDQLYTYSFELEDSVFNSYASWVGVWVKVPFGKTRVVGYVTEEPKTIFEGPEELAPKIKPIVEMGPPDSALSKNLSECIHFVKNYYQAPWGEVFFSAIPPVTTQEVKKDSKQNHERKEKKIKHLTEEQKEAVQWIVSQTLKPVLLEGVTGSGKTEVYLEVAREVLSIGKTVLVLLPEIALTSQLKKRFEEGLGEEVALWHSAVSPKKRSEVYQKIKNGTYRVVVGARSAVFAPLQNLGLIVVDEEHEATYKQEERFRYHARDVAVVRSKIENCKIILGSATPSLESQENVQKEKYSHVILSQRFGNQNPIEIEILDLKTEPLLEEGRTPLTQKIVDEIRDKIQKDEQVMIYLNQRGYAHSLLCESCGEVSLCPHCSMTLTYYKKKDYLQCHLCGVQQLPGDRCEHCGEEAMKKIGFGTESLEEEIQSYLPEARILRLDRSVLTSVRRLDQTLESFRNHEANLLLGTQMLVKGHDFPDVTLVVVILADALFRFPDFRASEKGFQTLLQVAGRSGRGKKSGKVMIQTYQPEHPVLQVIEGKIKKEDFYLIEKELRKDLGYPPYGKMVRARFEDRNYSKIQSLSQKLKNHFENIENIEGLEVLGPVEPRIGKVKDQYRIDLFFRSQKIEELQKSILISKKFCHNFSESLIFDVDPMSF